jgi:hypothetical protein
MAGGVINTGSIPLSNWPGIMEFFGVGYNKHAKTYPSLFDTVKSDKNYEVYAGVTGFGPGQLKPQGTGLSYDSQQGGFPTRLVNATYALGFIVTYEEIKDNQYKKITMSRTGSLAFSMLQAKEINLHLIYNRAANATYVGGDGVALASTAHPNVSGGTFANTPTVAADLSEASVEDGLIAVRGFQDDKGLFIDARVRSLVVPRQEFYNALRITKSVYQPGSANNDINATKAVGAIPEGVIESVYLTAPHTWFFRTDVGGDGHGMIYQEREKIRTFSDNDFDTFNYKQGAMERYTGGWADPRGLWVNPGP